MELIHFVLYLFHDLLFLAIEDLLSILQLLFCLSYDLLLSAKVKRKLLCMVNRKVCVNQKRRKSEDYKREQIANSRAPHFLNWLLLPWRQNFFDFLVFALDLFFQLLNLFRIRNRPVTLVRLITIFFDL